MDKIRVMEKPEWVSWDEIHNLLVEAHKRNFEKGIIMKTTTMSGEKIKNYIGEDGRCYVAFFDDKLVGTTSVLIKEGRSWYDKGKIVAKGAMSAILHQYQGLGLIERMNVLRDNYIASKNVQILRGDTPEDNKIVREIQSKKGFKEVRFFPSSTQNHFSVEFVKWLDGCPFSDRYIKFRFNLSKLLTKIQYKQGKIERNKLLSLFCRAVNGVLNRI